MNNQSKQKQAAVGEGSEEEKKSPADGEMSLPVDEPVVEEGPVEPEAQEVSLVVFIVSAFPGPFPSSASSKNSVMTHDTHFPLTFYTTFHETGIHCCSYLANTIKPTQVIVIL